MATTHQSTSAAKWATATTNRGSARAQAQEAEEFVEVTGGDFPGVWEFEERGDLIGTFLGTETINAKGKDRNLHSFEVDGETVTVWGTAILDSRLKDVDPGTRVKVQKPGTKVPTRSGHQAWEFKVYVAKNSIARR